MALVTQNTPAAGDVNVWGFRILFRHITRLSAATGAASTTLNVESARWFQVGDAILVGDKDTNEEATIDAINGNEITLAEALTDSYGEDSQVRLKAWWHLGHVRNPDRTQDRTVQQVQSAITGKLQQIKEIVTSVTKGMTFECISASDPYAQALHTGNPSKAGVISDTTVFVDDVNAVSGEILVIQENAETGQVAFVEYKPAAQLSGDGHAEGSDGENPTALSFVASFNSDLNYEIPTAIVADGGEAPLGLLIKTAPGSLDSVLDVFADLTT